MSDTFSRKWRYAEIFGGVVKKVSDIFGNCNATIIFVKLIIYLTYVTL